LASLTFVAPGSPAVKLNFPLDRLAVVHYNARMTQCCDVGLWLLRGLNSGALSWPDFLASAVSNWHASPLRFLPEELQEKFSVCRGLTCTTKAGLPSSLKRLHSADKISALIEEPEVAAVLTKLQDVITEYLAAQHEIVPFDQHVTSNVAAITRVLALTPVERDVLLFLAAVYDCTFFEPLVCKTDIGTLKGLYSNIYAVLGHDEKVIETCLQPGSTLVRSGILRLRPENNDRFFELSEDLARQIYTAQPHEVFNTFFLPTSPTSLTLDDFEYYHDKLTVFRQYLDAAIAKKKTGVNVLLYGRPGVGKSEVARVLAQSLGVPLFGVVEENSDLSAKDRDDRLTAYRLAQEILRRGSAALLLFDEVEDVFAPDSDTTAKQRAKGFVNRLLETNAVPTFWITNSCRDMDSAVLRRFDLVLNMSVPARKTRKKIAEHYFSGIAKVPEYLLNDNLSAADLARMAKVTEVIHAVSPETSDHCVDLLAEEYLKLYSSEHEILPRTNPSLEFDPALVNCSLDLASLAPKLAQHPCAVLCSGPFGSGRRSAARWLGESAGVVTQKSATDFISDSPHDTAMVMRKFFEKLRREGAVGVITDIDALFDCQTEDTDANNTIMSDNLATLISRHPGLVLCTSGPSERLPSGLLSCFAVTLEFDFLKPQQIAGFLNRFSGGARNVSTPCLPQNFIRAIRKAEVLGVEVTREYLVEELGRGGKKMGF